MRTTTPYSCLVLLLILICGSSCNKQKTDWKVALRKDQKNPYDQYLAHKVLPYYFPEAGITELSPGFNYAQLNTQQGYGQQGHSLLVLSGKSFLVNNEELTELLSFAGQGNEVFIACSHVDPKILQTLHIKQEGGDEYKALSKENPGAANINALSLEALPGKHFGMHGRYLRSHFLLHDTSSLNNDSLGLYASYDIDTPLVLGRAGNQPDFVRCRIGNGHITLHASPMVLTNYFLLQPGNREYLDQVWRSIPGGINTIYRASFYTRVPDHSSFAILMRHPATRWFLIIALFTLALYILFQLKRRQRIIPIIDKPQNTSAAFVETVGMLYFNKGDNANLALKMIQHFLEWVRSNYFLNTSNINDIFAAQLSARSGLAPDQVNELVALIHEVRLEQQVTDERLFRLYGLIQQFYKTKIQ
jgi:hypothetical protein